MCGIAAIAGWEGGVEELRRRLCAMNEAQRHRGPDGEGVWVEATGRVGLGHRRLKILDLSEAGAQPMASRDGRLVVSYNGEIYNYRELRAELGASDFRSQTDTEVLLAAWAKWGEAALERLVGMFAFVLWDSEAGRLYAVRDRFGVKPLQWGRLPNGALAFASEARAIHAAGLQRRADEVTWASALAHGFSDGWERTFWEGVRQVPAGCLLEWDGSAAHVRRWYDFAARAAEEDGRPEEAVREEYESLLGESVRLRFRSDVDVGVNLSGGVDSSVLAGLLREVEEARGGVRAFTFTTGDPGYDELPWVRAVLERTEHELVECRLSPEDVPALAERIFQAAEGPYGGLPTVAYANLFLRARAMGIYVLLDGQGMDEQWAGYDYYQTADGEGAGQKVQGSTDRATRPGCLTPEFRDKAAEARVEARFTDPLRQMQYRDAFFAKIPRALRYNDRVSMLASCELREPFLDHRLFELALRQPRERKIRDGHGKWMLREIGRRLLPAGVRLAPKRPVQTPQREWLRGPLRGWAEEWIEKSWALGWFEPKAVRKEWQRFLAGSSDNSAYVWQWICAGMLAGNGGGGRP
ncbi:MAG: asparagine synthase (glutamine-hydrolyzing), partial [Bryobacteraceae bacterium]